MICLADTNLLVRLANLQDRLQVVASAAVELLHGRGDTIQITPQV